MKTKQLFKGFLEYAKANSARPRTIKEYERLLYKSILQSIGERELEELSYQDINNLIETSKSQGETGPQKAIITLRNLLEYATRMKINIPLSWYDIKVPRVRQKPVEYLSKSDLVVLRESFSLKEDEEKRLLKAGGQKMVNSRKYALLRTRVLIELILCTGLRISEALSISLQDIKWDTNEISVKNAKTPDFELIYPSDYALEWIKSYLPFRNSTSDALFVSDINKYPYKAQRMGADTAKSFLYHHCKKLPDTIKKHIHHHIFRKTFVTSLLQEGMDLPSVKSAARHKSERTTLRYYGAITLERVKKLQLAIMDKLY